MLHKNFLLKAASLALAIFLWFWVMLNERNPILEESIRVRITPQGLGNNLALASELPQAEVRVRGLKRDMAEVRGKVEAAVSCAGLGEGSHRLSVHVSAPESVSVVRVRPTEVTVALDEVISVGRAVELSVTGEPPVGHALRGTQHSPTTVRVSGARSRVERVARVVATLELGRVVPGVAVSAPVRAFDSAGDVVEGVSLTPSQVSIMPDMESIVAALTLPVEVRTRGVLPAGLRLVSVQVEPPMITVLLPASRAADVDRVPTEEVPLGDVTRTLTRTVRLGLPADAHALGEPEVKVTIRVERAPAPPPPPGDEPAEGDEPDEPED